MNLHLKVFLLALLIACAFSLKGIGLNPIKPYYLNQGKSTSYLFSISPEQEVLTKAKIRIAFPYEFDHSKLASNLKCMASSSSYAWTQVPCQYSSPAIIITLNTIKDQPTYVLVSQPVNPVTYTMSSYFAVCLMYDNTITSCSKEFGKVVFPSWPSPNSGFVTPVVQSLNSNTVGQASTFQFTFGFSAFYDIGNTVRIKFPPGFTTTESPICQMAGTFNQVIKTFVWPDKRSIECQNINSTFVANATQVLKIIGIYNPQYAGNFGNTPQGFVIQMLKGTTTISLEQIYPTSQITIVTGSLVGRIDQQNNFIKSKTKYTFYMTLQNPLSSTNYIQMKFPSGWILYNGQCTVISGLTIGNKTLKCLNSTSGANTLMNISNFESASVSNQIVLSLLVGTPNTPGDYSVETITGNYNGIMDKMTTVVSLNATYGTIDMLSINAITANAKVQVGKTGPLQLTFFLNYQLPQTNVLTEGKFIMKIYPRIMLPDTLTNGVLKCYFFNNIPAKTCIWNDAQSASYTKVTITTPETISFQYSQIPITLTTEGAVNDSMIGITIADVVTRYRFELQAYKQQNATTPTQVYYTEYIADAILLPITTYSLTNQMNEYTHLRLELVGPYDFTATVVKDIRFKIEFLNSGWAANLGYLPNQIYKRFPCLLSQSTAYPPTYNNKVVCDLYTYTDGPHASLTDPSSRGPYILMYGFYPSLLKNANYRLEVGKFLIGSSSNIDAKIRFSIIQQTPDMLTPYVQLYYNEVSLFTTTLSAVSLQSNLFTTSMSNSQINVPNYHTHAYTVPSNGLAIIYEYDMSSTQSFTNQNFQCTSTNWCVTLGYPVNWVIEYKDSGTLPTSIASNFIFTNGNYADSFTGKARVFKVLTTTSNASLTKNIMTSLYKTTFSYSYSPSTPTSCSFGLSDVSFGTIYKNMEQYYVVTFYPATTTPSNGFVRLTLSSEMKFSPVPYCQPTNIAVLDSTLGLLCTLEDSRSTLKVYNIGALGAGSQIQIKVRIATQLASAASISPTIRIKTFRTLSIDTSLVDQKTGLLLSGSPVSNLYNNPMSFEIDNPRTVSQTPRVNYIGRLQMKFRPSSSSVSTPATKIRVYFHDHPWNTAKFTTPNNNVADPLVCKLNRKRVACTYTLTPFNILMNIDPAGLNTGSDNIITLDTEYIAPDNGIKHPAQAGIYMTTLHFYDNSMTQLQKTTFTHSIKPSKLRNLAIRSTVQDVGVENMFQIDFQTFSTITVNANNHATLYSRIFIEFPTKDSLGNNLFAADLGGYKNTGQYVGCSFYFVNAASSYVKSAVAGDYMKCRLVKSEVDGQPTKVEIINHDAFTSTDRWMTVYIAKVFNPAIAVTSVPITVTIQHVQVATNNVYQLYSDTYDVFMNSQNPTLQQTNGTRSTRSDTYENGKDIGDQGVFAFDVRKLGSVGISNPPGYYMALDLTDSMKPMNNQNTTSPAIYCHGSYFYTCLIFPQINYVIVWSYSENYYVYFDVKISEALSQVDTRLVARIWQNGRFMGFDHIVIYAANWLQIKGDITSYSFATVGNTWERALGRRKTEMVVSFRTDNGIPAGGSIEIIWPTSVPKAYPHCRSMISQGSILYAQGQTYNGEIGCLVQNTRNWVITSFQAVGQNALIVIVGQIDMPNSNSYIGTRYIYTYNNTHSTDIRTNGFVIDYFGGSLADIDVQNSLSWNVNSEITVEQTLTLRTGYVGPLQFKLQLNENLLGPKQGRIVVRVFKKSTILQDNGFAYIDKKYVCKIVQLQSNEQTGCIVQKVQNDLNISNENIKFTLFTSSNMLSTVPYKVVLTTQEGIQPQGLTFPTVPGTYKVSVSVDADSNTAFNIYNHLYLEVYGTPFKVMKVISMNTRPSEPNLLWIKLTPNTQILTTEQIILQFPTKSTGASGLVLFQNDLGTGQADGSDIKVDIIGGDFSNTFMKCRLFLGDSTYSKSAKIVCGGFQTTISNTQLLFFAIKYNNPPINGGRAHVSLPIFIYSMQQGKTYKKNFNVYDNAVQLRNDNGYNKDYPGDISTLSLQTSNGYIDMITRNWWDLAAGQYYILFFGFPLRKNGIVSSGCTWPGGSVYGNAYYHENIWAIVCQITSATISNSYAWNTNSAFNGFNTRNLRISGFYTPWYYLSAGERAVRSYSYHTTDITTSGIYTDLYPNASPKQASGPTFTMTAVHETATQYAGSRDDYIFEIIYSSTASNDISYMKKIAIIFPTPASQSIDFVLVGQDCVEATGSEVEIEECWIEPGGRLIWIRPVVKTSYTSNMKIRIQTRDLAIRNPTNNRTVYWNRFVVKFYSWENITQPAVAPLSNNDYCFLIIDNINGGLATTFALNPSPYSVQNYDYINYPHQRYFEQTPYQSLTHRAPIQIKFRPNHDFTTQTSQYHNIKIYYPASFGDYDKFKIRDLDVFRPVCYLNNFRIRKCTIDTTNNFISMDFMFALTNNNPYHIKVSLLDPRNPDINGFLASAAITDLVLTYKLAGVSTVYYMESDQFPTLFTLPTGITGGPFRGIVDGSVQYGHYINNQLNSINLLLTFNRTDIIGLVFEVPLRDSAGNYLYPTNAKFTAAFMGLQNGATYPCGNNGYGAGGNPKCIILNGDNTKETVSTKIIMTDFTYNTKMNCRFIFYNPQTNGAYFSVRVKAYGGTRSDTNLYGDKFMGEWNFMDIFQATTGTVDSNSYSRSYYRRPNQSPWRNNTEEYVFSKNYPMYADRMSLTQVLLYDNSSTKTDKQFCESTLGSSNDYDDLLEYTITSGGYTQKYAYFVTTWQSTTSVSYTGNTGWTLKYLKCRYYKQDYIAYFFMEKNSIQIATNTFDLNYPGTYGSVVAPTVKYFDQTRRFSDSTVTYFTMEIDFTATINSITNFEFRSRDAMVLLVTISDGIFWNNILSCQLLGGIISTSEQSPAQCLPHSSSQIKIINVAGFQANPSLSASTNKRVKFVFKVNYLNTQANSTDPTKLTNTYLYANYDALQNAYQPIFSESSTLLNNCQFANNTCHYSYSAGGGSTGPFSLDYLSDTAIRVTFKPYQYLNFGTDVNYNQYFRLQFHGFGFGLSCSISSAIAQISTSKTPGTGTNNTLDFTSKTCSDNYIDVSWTTNRMFSQNWGRVGLASNGQWDTSWYIILYLIVVPGAQDLPVMQHDYIFMSGTYNYQYSSNSWTDQVKNTAYLPIQSLATSATVSTLTDTREAVTELIFEVKSLSVNIGSTNTNYLLLAEFIGTSAWTGSSDPFRSYTNTAKNKQRIQCKCLSGVGPLSSSTTSPFVDAKCWRRLPGITVGSGTFNNFAILIDHGTLKNNDIKCYFPEFYVTSGMSLNLKFKTIYGDSYPTDIVSGTTEYFSMYTVTAPTVTYSGTTPSMSAPYTYGWNSLSDNFYSTAVTVGTKFSGIYSLTGDWNATLANPYLYLNLFKAGPIPVFSFCSDSNMYFECRVYSKLINVVVARYKSGSAASFSMTQGSDDLYYPFSQSSVSTFDGFAYVGTTSWQRIRTFSRTKSNVAPISTNKFSIFPDKYGSSRYNYVTNIFVSMNINGKTLYNYQQTGSKIQITFSSATITHLSNCQVWVQNEMSVELTCEVSSGKIIIFSKLTDYSTSNNIFVSLGITNPNAASVTFTMVLYDYYYSATRYSTVISRTATYTTDMTYASNSQLQKSRLVLYPFKSRMSMTTNVPLRIRFNIPTSPGAITYSGNGRFVITNTQFSSSSKYLCYFKQYTTWTNMIQQTEYGFYEAASCTSSSTVLSISPPKTLTINVNYFYELIVMPVGISSGARFNQAGFHQTNFQEINFIAYQNIAVGPSISAQQIHKLYQYEGNTRIGLQHIYLLSAQPTTQTSLYLQFSFDFTSPVNYPDHFIEIIFFDLPESSFSPYVLNDVIPCQLSSNFLSISNRALPQCRLASADTVNNFVKVRIQNFGNLAVGNYWISLDDFTLPSVTGGDTTKKFDISIGYYRPGSNIKYENNFKQIFLMDATNSTNSVAMPSLTFSNPATNLYGAPVVGTMSFTWPFDTSASDYESKISININGGFASSWSNIDSLTFTDPTLGTYQILWVNKKLNKFVFKIPNKPSGSATMTINNIKNPYPYQQTNFNNARNVEMNVYNNYFWQSAQTVSQPLFSYFQKNPSIIYINQNIPTNTIDNYPSTQKATLNGLVKLTLSVAFDQNTPDIILRQLDIIDITFTSGLSYIEECRAVKNDSSYVNPLTTCQTYYDGTNWHVKLYDITGSSLDIDWWIHVFAKFTSASLAYTFQISPKNLVPEYLTSYSTTLTNYDATKIIPTQLSWLNRKYVPWFYENQVKLMEPNTGVTTPYFKFRLSTPIVFDGASDGFYILLNGLSGTQPFRSKTQTVNLMCNFLPAVSAERDFSVGYYSRCNLQSTGSEWRWNALYIHGGLPQGDYLFQIVQTNIIDSAFYSPTTPTRTLIRTQLYRSQSNSNHYDSFYIHSYRYFRKAQIVHTTTTVSDYDTLRITYTPQGSLAAYSTNRQIVLRLSVHAQYLDTADGGIKSIFLDDNVAIQSGQRFSQVVSNPNGAEVTTIQFAQYSNNMSPLRFNLARQSAYTDNVEYIWRLPLLKNPSIAYISLRYNLTLMEYPSSTNYGIIFNHYEIVNDYYTQLDTSVAFTTSVINNLRDVQTVAGTDLSISLGSDSVATWDSVTFKLDKSKNGLIPSFANCNDTSNYNYYYFHTLEMVWAQKKSAAINTTTVGINALSSTRSYQSTFSFKWVKMFDSSNSKERFNPITMKYSIPPTLTLTPFTSYSAATLTAIQGYERQGSTVYYKILITTKIIPQGGEIRVMFDSTNFTSDMIGGCRVGSGFAKSSSYKEVLRCYRGLDGFVISGFNAIAAATSLEIYFYVKSLVAVTNSAISVDIYGLYRDNSTRISNAVVQQASHTASPYPTYLQRIEQTVTPYYRSFYSNYGQHHYYVIQGSFTLRASNLAGNTMSVLFTEPSFEQWGDRRFMIKKNSSSVTGWTDMTLDSSSCTNECRWWLPNNYINTLTFEVGQQYIWRYTTQYYNKGDTTRENGYYFQLSGPQRFIFKAHTGAAYSQWGYEQFVPKYMPNSYILSNRYPAAGKQTILDLQFDVDIDLTANNEIQLTFDTNNLLLDMFEPDLEGNVTTQTYRYLDCRQWVGSNNISTSRIVCLLRFGDRTQDPPKPAKLSIRTTRSFNGYPNIYTMRLLVSNIKNPSTVGMNTGVELNIHRDCMNSANDKCPWYSARAYFVTTSATQNLPATVATFSSNGNTVLQSSLTHTFVIPLSASLTSSGIIYIVYPQNYQGVMPNDCTATNSFTCVSFPTRRWIVLYPGTTYSGSTVSVAIYWMQSGYYAQAFDNRFKITVARPGTVGDVFYITAAALNPITSGISMSISATQTPNVWLRNYANTAIFYINYVFYDDRIKAIYIKAPIEVTSWTYNYCNATITNTQINTYPLRFECKVDETDSTFLKITRHTEQLTWSGSWPSYTIMVHAKFTLGGFAANQPILYTTMPNNSNLFYAYGSVNTTSPISKYYLSQTSQLVSISQHQVPIISEITFNQKSFAYRVARVNNKEVFYLLLRPTVGLSPQIGQLVFKVPDEFDYPGVFSHDSCFMLGRTKEDQPLCKQSREGGQTLIKLTPTNYNQQVKIIQLGSKLQANWFTAPTLPGDFYNMTVQVYSTTNVLLEKQTIDISPVYGEYFDIPSIQLNNILESNFVESVYDFTFVTGTLQIPPGAYTTSTSLTSQLQFVFENYNAANASNVFANDLQTGLKEGMEVGCVINQGIKALQNKRIKCLLHIGTNSTDKPMIKIINYDFINPGTTIKVNFAAIQSLLSPLSNTISLGVKMYYNDFRNSSTYLYILTPVLPKPTYAATLDSTRLPGWSWGFYTVYSGANVVLQPTSFSLRINVPHNSNYSGYQYSSTAQQHEFILLKFSPKFLIDPYNKVNIACAQCSDIEIFYATGIIRFRHTRTFSGSGYWYFDFTNFPTASYAIENYTVSVVAQIYTNYRRVIQSPVMSYIRTVQKCTKFDFGVLSVSSLNGGEVDVEYMFSIKTNHYIPPNGAVSISLPSSYGNMVTNNATCTLIGFQDTNAYCSINTPSRIDIYLNGSQLSQNYSYKIDIKGLQNPNNDSSNLVFIVTSYFESDIYKNKKICSNQITPPAINVKNIRDCTLEWQPDFSNMYYNATYAFFVSCSDQFRGNSIAYIKLPSEFSTRNKQGDKICTSYESTTLINNTCTLKYINGSLVLYANLDATSQTSFSIITNFINPINNTYKASAFVMSRGVKYAMTNEQSLTILSNSYATANTSDVFLLNNPKEGGLMSTYIFKITPIKAFSPENMAMMFPSTFNLDQSSLNIGLCVSDVSNLFEQLTYDNIQRLINNVSSVAGVSLKLYPSFEVVGNTIFVKNITNQLSTSLWTYVLIRGIKNPSSYIASNFTVAYYIQSVEYKALKWIYNYPLKYFISPPPNYLTVQKIQVSDYDLLYPSKYTFTFSSNDGNKVAIAGKKLSYVIVMPDFYKSTLWANTAPVCKFSSLATNSTCYSYESQIIITQTFSTNSTQLVLSISNILNPSLETFCNTTDVTLLSHTFFKIRIIEVASNAFLFESSAVVDNSNCLKFTSLRIPITLEYSLIMVAGLTYNITYGLTKPASNLKINAYIENQTGFTFSPSMVEFNDYYTLRNTTTLYLRSDIAAGTYTIKFNKYESELRTYFRNILPITVTVIKADQTSLTRPTISIESMSVSTIGYPVNIPVAFSMPSSTEMTLFMTIAEESNQTLQQYNSAFKDFTIAPKIINIKPQTSNYSFQIQHMQKVVPPPLTLSFKLTSLYPIIHNLTIERLYVCFDQDPKFDVLEPPMRVRITSFLESCNNKDVGKPITNIKVGNSSGTTSKTVSSVKPVIISIESKSLSSTAATLQVSMDAASTIYYLCQPSGYPAVTNNTLIKSMNSTIGFTGTATSSAMSIYSGTSSQINYKATIEITRLSPTSDYDIYVLSESTLGQSAIMKKSFKTTDLSKGIVMKLSFKSIVDSLTIVKALERILRISPIRIKVLTSTYELQLLQNTITSDKNTPYYVYEIVVAPDPLNDVKSPEQIVKDFINSTSSKDQFKTEITNWANLVPVTYYELKVIKPRVLQLPKPVNIYTYNCTFKIKMWQKSNIFAVLIEEPGKAANTLTIAQQKITPVLVSTLNTSERAKVPTSNQIRSGLTKDNTALNKYRYYSGATNNDGIGNIFFDDLQPGTKYTMYITSSSLLPYEPSFLWGDSEVIRLSFTTLYNQALNNQQINTKELKKYNPSLAAAIQKFQNNQDKKGNYSKLTKQ